METVGIRLSVCLSVSVRQACLVDSTLAVSTVVVSSRSVALSASAIQLFYICGPDLGDDRSPHICNYSQRQKYCPTSVFLKRHQHFCEILLQLSKTKLKRNKNKNTSK